MKVLHVITGLGSGGAERMLSRLVTNTDPPGRDTSHVVVSMMDGGMFGTRMQEAGIPVHCLGMPLGRPTMAGALELVRIVRREKPDVLQTWLYHADLLGTLVALVTPVPHVVWNLRCSDMELKNRSRTLRCVVWLLARLSSRVDAVIVNSDAGRRAHEQQGYRPPRWQLIPNGFDVEKLRPDATLRAASRALLKVGKDDVVIGMVARVDPQKDHPTFLDAAVEVARCNPATVFAFVGRGCEANGPLSAPIRQRGLEASVRLLGERADVYQILPGFDILALSSAYGEGFPNVVAEAMATGVTVVATDVGDCRQIVGDSGLIVQARAPAQLAGALNRMIAKGAARRRRLGQAARARIAGDYAIADVCARYDEFYRSLASKSY